MKRDGAISVGMILALILPPSCSQLWGYFSCPSRVCRVLPGDLRAVGDHCGALGPLPAISEMRY